MKIEARYLTKGTTVIGSSFTNVASDRRTLPITHIAKGRGAYQGWLRIQYSLGNLGTGQAHVKPGWFVEVL